MQLRRALVMGLVLGWGTAAYGGWVIEQSNVATRPKGDPGPAEPATLRVSQGRVRLTQPNIVTIQDCVKGRFIMYVPERNAYWSGSLDDYTSELRTQAAQSGATASGNPMPTKAPEKVPTVNAAGLPNLIVRKTTEQAKVAGYDTTKYVIESDGSLFQELWVTTAVNISDDLDPKKYVACQAKISAGMLGASTGSFNALYRSPDYLNLLTSGVILKRVTHHAAGTYSEEVRSINKADIADDEFAAPSGATKVSLNDLFAPPQR